ncbi:MAG: AraC family transcriptional regulator [Deltaproteobacteria bacterium]|nr:AraC family transcriptional regulator [Deltaproteobacteria bacterium]
MKLEDLCVVDYPHYHRTGAFVAWCHGPTALGVFAVGTQRKEDVHASAIAIKQLRRSATHAAFIADAREFGTEPEALTALFLQVPWAALEMGHHFSRISLVIPQGWASAWWQGLMQAKEWSGLRLRLHEDTAAAADWLGIDPELLASVERLATRLRAETVTHRALESFLRLHPTASIEAAARATGSSARTLQRLLAESGTSFVEVRGRARLELARQALGTDVKVETVAARIGFASRSHFARWFQAMTGTTPTAYRRSR